MSLYKLYSIIEYTVSALYILMGVVGIFMILKTNLQHYKFLCIYFILNAIGEFNLWILDWLDVSLYWQLNCVYAMIINEIFWVGRFLSYFLAVKAQKISVQILILLVIVFVFFYATNYSYLQSPRYPLMVLSVVLCLVGLMSLFELSKKHFSTFFKQADVIVTSSLVMIYFVVSLLYLLLDSIFEYSNQLGTQVMIFQHLVTIFGLLRIIYGIWLKEKFTPTASLMPSQRLRGQS